MDAARWWGAGQHHKNQKILDELERGNAPDDVKSRFKPQPFAVMPENWVAIQLFEKVNTQWIRQPMGGLVDLDYNAVDVVLKRLRLDPTPYEFEQLMLVGRVAAAERNKNT